jgi:macrolide transport system ATP-binding/permease protein
MSTLTLDAGDMSATTAAVAAADRNSRQALEAIPLIELRDIRRTFITGGGVEVNALRGIDLKIYPGEFVAIVGQSGSGKSTLMNLLGCLDRPTSGQYLFAGRDIKSFDADDLAWLRREAFGFVFQSYNLLAGSTAEENVEVPAIYAGLSHAERRIKAEALLTSLGLGSRLDHRPSQLSGGQQQRVSIARALMNGGKIILADEPTGALDSQSGVEVMALLENLARKGHTVIIITHDKEVADHADRVIEFRDGNIKSDSGHAEGAVTPATNDELQRLFMSRKAVSMFGALGEAIRMALISLRTNLLRTFLTLLGIVFGVASVVTMLAIGEGAKQQIYEMMSQRGGANQLNLNPGSPNSNQSWRMMTSTLTFEDADEIAANVPNLLGAQAMVTSQSTLRYQNIDYNAEVIGIGEQMPALRNWPLARGVYYTRDDSETYATVAVLGAAVYEQLFPTGADPLGEYLLVGTTPFQIIGVMTRNADDERNEAIYVPVKSAALRLFGSKYANRIEVLVDDVEKIDATEQDLREFMISRHGTEDFRVFNSAEMLETITESQEQITNMLGAVAAISLLVGGIGVMNIMLTSVIERTREIGIRMATGARKADILAQFLAEAIVVSAVGGVVGLGLGIGAALALQAFAGNSVHFTAAPMILAFSCATATGLVFGFAPARKAANLDPVVALANE